MENAIKTNEMFEAVIRGVQLWEATSISDLPRGALPVLSISSPGNSVCIALERGSYLLSRRDETDQLFGKLDFSIYGGCLMSNDTCIHSLSSPLQGCSDSFSFSISYSRLIAQEIYELAVAYSYYERFGIREIATESILNATKAVRFLRDKLKTDSVTQLCGGYSAYSQVEVNAVRDIGLFFAEANLLQCFCGRVWNSTRTMSISAKVLESVSFLNVSNISKCESVLLGSVAEYLLSPGIDPPPITISACNLSIATPLPSLFFPPGNSSSLDPATGVITIDSGILAKRFSRNPTISSNACPRKPPALECEQIGSNECSKHPGCWISWGPCQSAFLGYYSPSGSVNQVPCPSIQNDQFFVQGDADSFCVYACKDADQVLNPNKTCVFLEPGKVLDTSCSSRGVLNCTHEEGFIFTKNNSCVGRFISPALGGFTSIPIESDTPLTIQSWVRMNTLALGVGGPGTIVSLLGSFGNYFMGIRYESTDSIRFVLALASAEPHLVLGPPVPHIRNEWVHLSAEINTTFVTLYRNGAMIFTQNISLLATNPFLTMQSIFAPELVPQYLTFLNKVHYGPFGIDGSEFSADILQGFFALYTLQAFPEIQLFNPEISNDSNQGFFGVSPPGFRPPATSNIRSRHNWCKSNYCLNKPSLCFEPCEFSMEWNPFICLCEPVPTSSSTSTSEPLYTTLQTITAPKEDLSRNINTGGTIVGILVPSVIAIGAILCCLRGNSRRKVKRVCNRSKIHALPSTDFLFDDASAHFDFNTLITHWFKLDCGYSM